MELLDHAASVLELSPISLLRLLALPVLAFGVIFSHVTTVDAAIIIAARLYTSVKSKRADLVSEWRALNLDMTPAERLWHAATLMHTGVRRRVSGQARREARRAPQPVAPHAHPAIHGPSRHLRENPRGSASRALWSSVAAVIAVVGPVSIASATNGPNTAAAAEPSAISVLQEESQQIRALSHRLIVVDVGAIAEVVSAPTTG